MVSVAEAVRYRRPHIPDAVRERSVVVIQVPNIDRTDYEKENNEHSHVTSPLLRVRGKFVVALPRGACLWTTPLDENERVQPIHWPVTAMLPIAYKDLTNGFRLRRSVRRLLFLSENLGGAIDQKTETAGWQQRFCVRATGAGAVHGRPNRNMATPAKPSNSIAHLDAPRRPCRSILATQSHVCCNGSTVPERRRAAAGRIAQMCS